MEKSKVPDQDRRVLLKGVLTASAGVFALWGTNSFAVDALKSLEPQPDARAVQPQSTRGIAIPTGDPPTGRSAGAPIVKHSRFPGGAELLNANPATSLRNLNSRIIAQTGLESGKVEQVLKKLAPNDEKFVLTIAKGGSQFDNLDVLYDTIAGQTGVKPETVHQIHAMSFRTVQNQTLVSKGIPRRPGIMRN